MSHGIIFQVLKANINYWGNIDFKLGDRDDLLWKHKLQWSKKVCTVKLLHAMQLPSPMWHIIHSEDGRLNPTFSVFSGIKRKHWEKVKKIFSMNPSKLLVGHKNLKRNYPMKNFQLKRKTIPPIRNLSSHYLDVKSTSSQNSFSTWHHGDICDTEENLKNIWKANFKTDSFKFDLFEGRNCYSKWHIYCKAFSCLWFTACKVSVFGVILVRIFPHSEWIWKDSV